MRGLWLAVALVLVVGSAAWAAERSPAALLPAEVGLYAEVNLRGLSGDAADNQALQGALGISKLMEVARGALAKEPELSQSVEQVFTVVTTAGKALGWRVGGGISGDMSSVMGGGTPDGFIVANVADAAACEEAMRLLRAALPKDLPAARMEGEVKVTDLSQGQAALAQGKDWIAVVFPAASLPKLLKLASGENTKSLAANEAFQRASARVPADAVFVEYVSPAFMRQALAGVTMMMPDLTLPEPPKDGTMTAMSLKVEEVQGRQVLKATWQTDLDAAAFMVQGPLAGALGPAITQARGGARKAQCLTNVKNLSLGMQMYVMDYEKYPKADQWVTQLNDYIKSPSIFKCPSDTSGAKCSYGMNWGLSGKPDSSVKDAGKRVVFYETANPGDCPRGGKSDVASPPRHMGGNNFGYADGHARWLPQGAETDKDAVNW